MSQHHPLTQSGDLLAVSVRKKPIAALIAGLIMSNSVVNPANSATINVNSDADDGAGMLCTLREAIVSINEQSLLIPGTSTPSGCEIQSGAFGTDDRIIFSIPDASTVTLSGSQLEFERTMTVDASDVNSVTINAAGMSRVVSINSGDITLSHTRLTGGVLNNYNGAGIYLSFLSTGSVTLDTVVVQNNRATGTGSGGGIFINNGSTVSITDSTISGNSASVGGGIRLNKAPNAGKSTINNGFIFGNTASIAGGGLSSNGHDADIQNIQIFSNEATTGGGIYASNSAEITIENLTMSGNQALNGGGIVLEGANVTISTGPEPFEIEELNGKEVNLIGANKASSGAVAEISNNSQLTIEDSLITGSEDPSGDSPSIIEIETGSSLELDRVSVALNIDSGSSNAAITQDDGLLTITNSIFAINFQPSVHVLGGNAIIQNSTFSQAIVNNGDAGGVKVESGATATLRNSILANTLELDESGPAPVFIDGDDCVNQGALTIDQETIVERGACGQNRAIDPGVLEFTESSPGGALVAFANEGFTVPLLTNSPAINTGDNATCPEVDYNNRLRDSSCDVGAIEFVDAGFFVIPLAGNRAVVIPE